MKRKITILLCITASLSGCATYYLSKNPQELTNRQKVYALNEAILKNNYLYAGKDLDAIRKSFKPDEFLDFLYLSSYGSHNKCTSYVRSEQTGIAADLMKNAEKYKALKRTVFCDHDTFNKKLECATDICFANTNLYKKYAIKLARNGDPIACEYIYLTDQYYMLGHNDLARYNLMSPCLKSGKLPRRLSEYLLRYIKQHKYEEEDIRYNEYFDKKILPKLLEKAKESAIKACRNVQIPHRISETLISNATSGLRHIHEGTGPQWVPLKKYESDVNYTWEREALGEELNMIEFKGFPMSIQYTPLVDRDVCKYLARYKISEHPSK